MDHLAHGGNAYQLAKTVSGTRDFVTGRPAGSNASSYDLDGTTTIRSVPIQLPAQPGPLSFAYYFSHKATSSSADSFRVYVEADGARTEGSARIDPAKWLRVSRSLTAWAGKSVRIVFKAADLGPNGLVEAAVDDVRIERP